MTMPRGFTLMETILAVTLTAFMFVTLSAFIRYFYTESAALTTRWQTVESSRAGIARAMIQLRAASNVGAATDSSITFVTGREATSTYTYALNGASLQESGRETATIATALVTDPLAPLFTYYDANGALLSEPVDPTQIRIVRIRATINAAPDQNPTGTTLISGAALRNLAQP